MTQKLKFFVVLIAVAILIMPTRPAMAYLDPGTGSYVYQIIIGSALAGAYTVKVYWKAITTKVRQMMSKKESNGKP